ncbi:MAG: hypothetical protein P8L47_00020 [Candidatus Marinamargulisbacteria bacterium]|nr:hypothetical protein [Candidatus Marinamargulisbacteria bacterium]
MIKLLVMSLVVAISVGAADVGDVFIKKTILSPQSAWVFSDVEADEHDLGNQFANTFAKKIKRMKRFDFVQFDPAVFQPVYESLHATSTANIDSVTHALKTHVLDDIETLITSDAYKRRRVRAIQQHRGVSFAKTKGKSSAYTVDELSILMNAIYVYIPYIKSVATTTVEGPNPATVRTITGGVLWYNVQMSSTGNIDIVLADNIERTSTMVLPASMAIESLMDIGIIGSLQSKTIKATKAMPMFTLVSKTTSVSGRDYTLSLTKDSGANLDDLFFLQEDMDVDGRVKRKTVGIMRIAQSSRDNWVVGYQHTGSVRDRGGYVIESPRRGFQLGAGIQQFSEIQAAQILKYADGNQVSTLPFKTASGWYASLDYNIGRHFGVSQLFLGVDYSGLALHSAIGDFNGSGNRVQTYHTRVSKKFWWQRHALRLDIGTGTEWFRLSNNQIKDYELKLRSMKYGIGYELMLGSRWLLTATATQSRIIRLSKLSYKLNDTRYNYSASDANQLGVHYNRGYMTYQWGVRVDF